MSPKNPAAVALGRRGGQKYAENTSAADRKERARQAAAARWDKTKELVGEISKGAKALEARATKKQKKKGKESA